MAIAKNIKVKEVKNKGLEREYEVTLVADYINDKVENKLKETAKKIKMPGFRPGKVPVKLVKKKHGKEILGEVLEHAVADSSQQVMDERKLQPALQPKIEVSSFDPEKENTDLVYNLSFEIYPEVPELDLAKIKVEKAIVDVTEKEVKDGLKRLAESQKNFEPVKKARAAKKGDAVLIDFVGKKDGVEFEGGAGKDFQLELGSGQFIPGFEDQLIGAKKGDKKVVKVTFPEQYGSADLAGAKAEFDVTVHDVLEAGEPKIDDDFAKKFGLESAAKLKEVIKEQIAKDFGQLAMTKTKKELFDTIEKTYSFEVPQGMTDMEFNAINQAVQNAPAEKKLTKKEEEKQQKEFKELAVRRVRLGIILADIGRKNAITVSEDEIRGAVFTQARNYPGQEQQVIEFYQKNPQALDQIKGPILEDKVVEFILSKVKTTEKKMTADELLKFQEEEE